MLISILLLALGLLLIFLEFFLPGAILGIAGGLFLVLSMIFFAKSAASGFSVLFYILGIIALTSLLIWSTLRRIKKGKIKGFYLSDIQEGYLASHFEKELIGKEGEAFSDLKPSGHIVIEGKRYQAVSKLGYLEKGSKIQVVSGEGAHLIVTQRKT